MTGPFPVEGGVDGPKVCPGCAGQFGLLEEVHPMVSNLRFDTHNHPVIHVRLGEWWHLGCVRRKLAGEMVR